MKVIITLLVSFIAMVSYSQDNSSLTDQLTLEIEQLTKENEIVGFSTAIYNEKGTLYAKGFGYSDKAKRENYTANTIQNIASISKTFIGMALLRAQELNKLRLDDPINKYLPFEVINPYHPNETITIRHLTTHTSSIRDRYIWYGTNCYILKERKKVKRRSSGSVIQIKGYL